MKQFSVSMNIISDDMMTHCDTPVVRLFNNDMCTIRETQVKRVECSITDIKLLAKNFE